MEPVQLVAEIPVNMVVSRFLRRKHFPGSEYYRLSEEGVSPRVYQNTGKARQPVTTITDDVIIVEGGGFGKTQRYQDGFYGYDFNLIFFNALEAVYRGEGKFKSMGDCKREANSRRYG